MTGTELKRLRLAHGLTQVELARQIGYTSNHLARLERGLFPIREHIALLIRSLLRSPGKRGDTAHASQAP